MGLWDGRAVGCEVWARVWMRDKGMDGGEGSGTSGVEMGEQYTSHRQQVRM